MKGFWSILAKLAVKAAMYAADHPDQVIQIVNDVKAAKAAKL